MHLELRRRIDGDDVVHVSRAVNSLHALLRIPLSPHQLDTPRSRPTIRPLTIRRKEFRFSFRYLETKNGAKRERE